ncbi:TrmH family RNA methyltransferase [Sphaerisporangium sp. TRM90804]|uniref:TrmH family RNA methyltransferase n=1 Tax=Sphaerisporangium sp. TRM90804 TaxID=3031113 RepID=UPI002446D32C|nr:TrmH family RNA methyltransferase [Sphaerisporangium sp. TRM90804]MDH2430882.1 TrmH family RNA methyltransferase [Sphaerisporangium sp. TRM90804]
MANRGRSASGDVRITRANARFQQWQALLGNRAKRQRAGEFLIQGVRPISLAVEFGWPVRALIYDAERPLSNWAEHMLKAAGGERVAMAPDLLRELGGKDEDVPELVAVAGLPDDELSRIQVGPSFLGAVFDRPNNPGNIGTMARSLDAFGGAGLIVTGHAADPYDPRSVRASTGSLLALPVVRSHSHREVLEWVERLRAQGLPLTVAGTDESGACDVADLDLTGPTLLVIGNETTGLSAGWRQACDTMARIPMAGSASSLNAAGAATVVLYEAARQRRRPTA